ncbi:uncharacterized protein UV8b_07955 [Ustilaginoidea virens]|uniref:DNA polymerase kappa n=1 Tax=Ustilaginoidea virens TaxID=1159556 RepID=A0A8E5HYU9_USTVR|nr:uncharacterized protein UV8b_07955 [Ustilaginoidea virens]QUC23714.1 hypothetical protein UV8b_07955 [Ustilaginoidea virens]
MPSTPNTPKGQGHSRPSSTELDKSKTLKYQLLGASLTKAGQDNVDQSKVSEIIYNASKGSKFFNREEARDQILTHKIERILAKKIQLNKKDLTAELRNADRIINEMELSRDLTQCIVHIDCDAFYAAVEQLERPELKDVPFAVGAGVLTTCNYAARQFGCRSGMAGFVAKKLCPSLILIRPNFQKYAAKAEEVREILADYDPRFESASIDEAYLNITQYCQENNMGPAETVEQLRREIHQRTAITVSAGIAANAKLAKICSNLNKPNGQYVLPSDRACIMRFMRDLPTRKVNGIGRVLERELSEIGVNTCGDIYQQREYLNALFGRKTFDFLIGCCLGLGRTRIQPAAEYERKSVGTESTFRDMSDSVELREKLRWTAEELERDMKRIRCKGRTLCLKVKLHTFEVLTRQIATPKLVSRADDLYSFSLPMLTKLEQEIPGMKLRLMGLRCTHLVSSEKPDAMAFFGFKAGKGDVDAVPDYTNQDSLAGGSDSNGPHDEISHQVQLHKGLSAQDVDAQGLNDGLPGRHGREVVPDGQEHGSPKAAEAWWDCPVCLRPQEANQKAFNGHIDSCLSRQAIRDAVQGQETRDPQLRQLEPRRQQVHDKKRGRAAQLDRKQKKLSFR